MAGALAVGLAVGTVLTLVVTPCALVVPETLKNIFTGIKIFLNKIERKIFSKESPQA
jgi:hypothetical protein